MLWRRLAGRSQAEPTRWRRLKGRRVHIPAEG
jgi:hypothetical protein